MSLILTTETIAKISKTNIVSKQELLSNVIAMPANFNIHVNRIFLHDNRTNEITLKQRYRTIQNPKPMELQKLMHATEIIPYRGNKPYSIVFNQSHKACKPTKEKKKKGMQS